MFFTFCRLRQFGEVLPGGLVVVQLGEGGGGSTREGIRVGLAEAQTVGQTQAQTSGFRFPNRRNTDFVRTRLVFELKKGVKSFLG